MNQTFSRSPASDSKPYGHLCKMIREAADGSRRYIVSREMESESAIATLGHAASILGVTIEFEESEGTVIAWIASK